MTKKKNVEIKKFWNFLLLKKKKYDSFFIIIILILLKKLNQILFVFFSKLQSLL